MPHYSPEGYVNVTVVPGTSFTGLMAPDGSINVIESPGTSFVGFYHPCGAMYVTVNETSPNSRYAPDGSTYVTETGQNNGAMKVNVVSGSLSSDLLLLEDGSNLLLEDSSTILLEG